MKTIYTKYLSKSIVFISIMIALYNTYNSWFNDDYSPSLTTLVIVFIALAFFVDQICKRKRMN